MEPTGIEPATSCVQNTRSTTELWPHFASRNLESNQDLEGYNLSCYRYTIAGKKWSQSESNRRPLACRASALPLSYNPICCTTLSKTGYNSVAKSGRALLGIEPRVTPHEGVVLPLHHRALFIAWSAYICLGRWHLLADKKLRHVCR